MKASIVDLRYRMNDVLKALERNEEVRIMYRGRLKGVLKPRLSRTGSKVKDHPFFNMRKGKRPVAEELEELRGGRHRDL